MDFKEFENLSIEYFNHRVEIFDENKKTKRIHPKIINSFDQNANIVDAGCGDNIYKNSFHNLISFDIVDYGNQDYVCSIMNAPIEEASQDGVLCLGVLHECPDEYHIPNLEKMLSWLKPNGKIIMRCKAEPVENKHPHGPHGNIMTEYFAQGMWDNERINLFSKKYNLIIEWKKNIYQTRHSEWNGKSVYNKENNADVTFNGYMWCWRKNATV